MGKETIDTYNCDVCKEKDIEPVTDFFIPTTDIRHYDSEMHLRIEPHIPCKWIPKSKPSHICIDCFFKYFDKWREEQNHS